MLVCWISHNLTLIGNYAAGEHPEGIIVMKGNLIKQGVQKNDLSIILSIYNLHYRLYCGLCN